MNGYDPQSIPEMLTIKEAALKFGIAQHHARQLALTGRVRAVRAGKKILINAQSVVDYFNTSTLISSDTYDNNHIIKF